MARLAVKPARETGRTRVRIPPLPLLARFAHLLNNGSPKHTAPCGEDRGYGPLATARPLDGLAKTGGSDVCRQRWFTAWETE